MSTDEKMKALTALGGALWAGLHIRPDGTWYVRAGIEISDGAIARSPSVSEPTPEKAILAYWNEITQLKPGEFLRVDATREKVRWNEYMWERQA